MQGAKILVIDDDRETRWALGMVLRREGAQVTEASDGEEGLRCVLRSQYDLVVSDVCMPGLGGFGLYAALRFGDTPEIDACRAVPIILLSGRVPARDLAQALDAGVDDIMEKPADPEEFKARVRAVLRRARSGAAPRARTRGDLADFGMAALAQALHLAARSLRLTVQSGFVSATLDFHSGSIAHAAHDEPGAEYRGEDAALRTLGLTKGVFQILPLPDPSPRTIFAQTQSLLLRAATRVDEVTEESASAAAVTACAAAVSVLVAPSDAERETAS